MKNMNETLNLIMLYKLTFSDSEFNNKRHKTRKEILLSRMDELIP